MACTLETIVKLSPCQTACASQWRHNEHDGVSNHQPHGCFLNRLSRRSWKKTSKLRVTGLCVGNSPVTGEFLAQRTSNVKNISIWWRHNAMYVPYSRPDPASRRPPWWSQMGRPTLVMLQRNKRNWRGKKTSTYMLWVRIGCRVDSRFAHSQWETSLQSNTVSHRLDGNLESALGCKTLPVTSQESHGVSCQHLSQVVFNSSPLDKMVAISQTTFSNTFSWMKTLVFLIDFHWSLFLRV